MSDLHPTSMIYISQSRMPHAGRGVFAKEAIKKGETIERCPTIEIPLYEQEIINQTMLVSYIYYLGESKDMLTIVLGFGSIYNHSYTPNAIYDPLSDDGLVQFIAEKDIKKDEEICVNYNQEVQTKTPLWFEY